MHAEMWEIFCVYNCVLTMEQLAYMGQVCLIATCDVAIKEDLSIQISLFTQMESFFCFVLLLFRKQMLNKDFKTHLY